MNDILQISVIQNYVGPGRLCACLFRWPRWIPGGLIDENVALNSLCSDEQEYVQLTVTVVHTRPVRAGRYELVLI